MLFSPEWSHDVSLHGLRDEKHIQALTSVRTCITLRVLFRLRFRANAFQAYARNVLAQGDQRRRSQHSMSLVSSGPGSPKRLQTNSSSRGGRNKPLTSSLSEADAPPPLLPTRPTPHPPPSFIRALAVTGRLRGVIDAPL